MKAERKTLFNLCAGLFVLISMVSSCQKSVDPKLELEPVPDSIAYFEKLKAYKKSPHQIMAGYYRTWGDSLVESNAGQKTMLAIPDSVDIVNVFTDYTPATSPFWTTLRDQYIPYLHRRGTRVVYTRGMPWTMSVTDRNVWVQNIKDDTQNYNYDGIDLDFESGGGTTSTGLFGGFFNGSQQDLDQIALNIKALGAHFGPASGTGKLFILDLNYVNLPPKFLKDIEPYIDYFFMQRYFGGQLDKLYNEAYKGNIPPGKYVLGASFENGSARNGTPALFYQYAAWQPSDGKKGGLFSYGLDADGTYSTPSYIFTKKAIQLMNPAN